VNAWEIGKERTNKIRNEGTIRETKRKKTCKN
jgi:hypothetical protein